MKGTPIIDELLPRIDDPETTPPKDSTAAIEDFDREARQNIMLAEHVETFLESVSDEETRLAVLRHVRSTQRGIFDSILDRNRG